MNRQQLVAAERWLLLQELISQVRHPVRNKLGSVRNAAFFIRRTLEKSRLPADPRVTTFFQLIDEELSAVDRQLVSGFGGDREHSFSRRRTRLSECIDSALSLRAYPAGTAISVQCAEDRDLYLCAEEMTVALCCLLDNAWEAVAQGGEIAIVTSSGEDYVALSVIDSGCGFSAESVEHAFDAFYSTKQGHLGLGLNLVQRILREHGGRAILGPPASGTRVTALLPRALSATDPQHPLLETT